MGRKKERRVNSYLHSQSLLFCSAAKVAVVVVAFGCVYGLRYVGSHGGWCSSSIEK